MEVDLQCLDRIYGSRFVFSVRIMGVDLKYWVRMLCLESARSVYAKSKLWLLLYSFSKKLM